MIGTAAFKHHRAVQLEPDLTTGGGEPPAGPDGDGVRGDQAPYGTSIDT